MSQTIVKLLFVAMISATIGCGKSDNNPASHKISGTVTFDGQPLPEGKITFEPIDGKGRSYSADIVKGSYSAGVEPASYKVKVTASRIIPGKFDTSNGEKEPVGEMYIPKQYNANTTLKADIGAGKGPFDFELKSK